MDRIASSFRALTRRFFRIRTKVAPDTPDKVKDVDVSFKVLFEMVDLLMVAGTGDNRNSDGLFL
ncbi:hypothetical protein HPP92_005907 [Vanilla planifolia]|uniref:Uncharacterized protein n=1 Tax=Vanilla planifolia TaxID=51239 RepID=A0A835RNP9_VANPL|nr:hypothetical protein HPP92_005907 [Vanilla planifolia]